MKTTLPLLLLFVFIVLGGYLYSSHRTAQIEQATATTTPVTASSTPAYTLAQVAAHTTSTDCWVAIAGNVYDLTAWIAQHPGGMSAIVSLCGKDGTEAFSGQHAKDPRAQAVLTTFKIGSLASY